MSNVYFEILRPGINTTIQDSGRHHMYHEGIAVSGAIDKRNFKLANKLVDNPLNEAVIEFAYQGPLLKLKNNKIMLAQTALSAEIKNSEIKFDDSLYTTIDKNLLQKLNEKMPNKSFNFPKIISKNLISATYEKGSLDFREIINYLNQNEIKIEDITTEEGDLEDVFLQLTKH